MIGVLVLLPLVAARGGGLGPLRGHLVPLVVLGALNNAIPFWLLGFAETRLDSGLTAVIQAAAPIFTVLLASRIDPSQRVRGVRLVGIAVGFVGVALLVGVQHGGEVDGGARRARDGLSATRSRCSSPAAPCATLPPLQVSRRPARVRRGADRTVRARAAPERRRPRPRRRLAVVALGALGSGVAYLLYFAIIASAGASRAILVTYLVPAFALVYGAVFLDEAITASALGGLALILGGTALATGLAKRRAVRAAAAGRRVDDDRSSASR